MQKLFSLDGPVYRFLSTVGKLILLSLCWLVCCLPVLTVGASTTAMFHVAFGLRKEEGEGVLKAFFKAFVRDFKLGTLCWLSMIAIAAVLYCIPNVAAMFGMQLLIAAAVALSCAMYLLCWLVLACLFPLAAYFDNTLKKTLKNALFIAVRHRKQSIGSALFLAVPLFVFLLDPMIFAYTCGVWALIFPGVWAYFTAGRFAPIFEEYGNKRNEKTQEETGNETL